MKSTVTVLSMLVLCALVYKLMAREYHKQISCIYQSPVRLPSFPGGEQAWNRNLFNNTRLDSIDCVPQGTVRVVLNFNVDTTGKVSDVKMETNDCPAYGKMLAGILQRGPRWNPAVKDGLKISYRHSVTVSTCLLPSEE
jgi:hypothetical protein